MSELHYGRVLRESRERAGKSIDEVAWLMGISRAAYYHWEEEEEGLFELVSLRELLKLSASLGISVVDLFVIGPHAESVSLDGLAKKINEYLIKENMSVLEFEDLVGWELEGCLSDPDLFQGFNIVGLIDACEPLGIDWRSVLRALRSSERE